MTFSVKHLYEFADWLNSLKDGLTLQRLVKRLRNAQLGNLGDAEPVGGGVFEMREHFWARLAHLLRSSRRFGHCDAGWR